MRLAAVPHVRCTEHEGLRHLPASTDRGVTMRDVGPDAALRAADLPASVDTDPCAVGLVMNQPIQPLHHAVRSEGPRRVIANLAHRHIVGSGAILLSLCAQTVSPV